MTKRPGTTEHNGSAAALGASRQSGVADQDLADADQTNADVDATLSDSDQNLSDR